MSGETCVNLRHIIYSNAYIFWRPSASEFFLVISFGAIWVPLIVMYTIMYRHQAA